LRAMFTCGEVTARVNWLLEMHYLQSKAQMLHYQDFSKTNSAEVYAPLNLATTKHSYVTLRRGTIQTSTVIFSKSGKENLKNSKKKFKHKQTSTLEMIKGRKK